MQLVSIYAHWNHFETFHGIPNRIRTDSAESNKLRDHFLHKPVKIQTGPMTMIGLGNEEEAIWRHFMNNDEKTRIQHSLVFCSLFLKASPN